MYSWFEKEIVFQSVGDERETRGQFEIIPPITSWIVLHSFQLLNYR